MDLLKERIMQEGRCFPGGILKVDSFVNHQMDPIPVSYTHLIMMFGSILFAGFGMMARTGFSQRNMVIVSLSLSVGLGFTSATGMFNLSLIHIWSLSSISKM